MAQFFGCTLTFLVLMVLVAAELFDEDSLVKMIGHDELKAILEEKMTSVVAFVGSPCEDCELFAPQYSKTALGLYPFLPMHAVDCQESENARLCAEQKVTKFPTLRLFPRGKHMDPKNFRSDGSEMSATDLYYFAQRGVPDNVKILRYFEDLDQINAKAIRKKPRALLLKRTNKLPLLWSVLANKYSDDIEFFSHRDWRGKSSVKMGLEVGEEGESKVLIYPAGEKKPVLYKGILKLDSLTTFFDSLLNGETSVEALNAIAAAEEFIPDPKLLEIEKQQEVEMLKLAHGGFADLIDFEAAVRDGSAKNFHGKQAYPGMMGGSPRVTDSGGGAIHSNESSIAITEEAGQIVVTEALTMTETDARSDNAVHTSIGGLTSMNTGPGYLAHHTEEGNTKLAKDAVPEPTAASDMGRTKDEL